MTNRIANSIENLDRIYNAFIAENDERSFYTGVYDYTSYVIENSEFNDAIKKIKKDEFQSNARLNKVNALFKNELLSVEKNVLQIIAKNKIQNEKINQHIETLYLINKMIEKDDSGTDLKHKYSYLVNILELLHSSGFEKQIKKYFKTGDSDLSDYEFSTIYNDYIEAIKSFIDNKKVSYWGCWDELMNIYSIFSIIEGKKNKHTKEELIKISEAIAAVEDKLYSKSIKKEAKEKNRIIASSFLESENRHRDDGHRIKEIQLCAKRIHSYLINEMERKNTSPFTELTDDKKERIPIFFSYEKGFYAKDNSSYPIKKKRAKLIDYLKDGKKDGAILAKLWGHNDHAQLSKDINQINKLFKKKLGQKEKIIISIPTGGYKLNNDTYSIKFISG